MNMMHRLTSIIIASLFFVPVMSAKTITVKLLKTDQETWKKPFSYALVGTENSKKTQWSLEGYRIRKNVRQREQEIKPSFKSMNKNGSVSFDTTDLSDQLIVCTQPNEKGTCHHFDLEDHRKMQDSNLVVGIDKLGKPTTMTQQEANRLIDASKPPTLHSVAVKKIGDNRDLWTIKAIKSNTRGEQDIRVVYGKIKIKKDTFGLNVSKLKVPRDTEFFISVEDENKKIKKDGQKFASIEPGAVLTIRDDMTVAIKGAAEAAAADALDAAERAHIEREEEDKAKVQREAQEAAEAEKLEIARKRAQEKREQEEKLLQVRLRLANSALIRARSGRLTENDIQEGLGLLADKKHEIGDLIAEAFVRSCIENVEVRKELTKEDKDLASNLLLERRNKQFEQADSNLKEALAQPEADYKMHLPDASGAAVLPPSVSKSRRIAVKGVKRPDLQAMAEEQFLSEEAVVPE